MPLHLIVLVHASGPLGVLLCLPLQVALSAFKQQEVQPPRRYEVLGHAGEPGGILQAQSRMRHLQASEKLVLTVSAAPAPGPAAMKLVSPRMFSYGS